MTVFRVLLFLLKLLGILLLVLLGLVLVILLLVLLAPVRYKGRFEKREKPEPVLFADALVSWLNPLLRVRIHFREGKWRYTVRLFGICLSDSARQKRTRKKKQKKEKKKKTKGKPEENLPETTLSVKESYTKESRESGTKECRGTPEQEALQDSAPEKKESLFAKLKRLWERLLALPAKIKEIVQGIFARIRLIWKKKEAVSAFLTEEMHITALGRTMGVVKKLFAHILPGKLKGHVEFGTGDPESTGKALAALGILYAAYGKGIMIVPDFNEKRLAAELTFRGRVRAGTVLLLLLRLVRDKQVRGLYKDWKQLMSLLKEKAE